MQIIHAVPHWLVQLCVPRVHHLIQLHVMVIREVGYMILSIKLLVYCHMVMMDARLMESLDIQMCHIIRILYAAILKIPLCLTTYNAT